MSSDSQAQRSHWDTQRLTPELLVRAYCTGAFPMADARDGAIRWYSPDPRAVIPLDAFHVPRSLRRTIRRGVFQVRVNTAFGAVIRACAGRSAPGFGSKTSTSTTTWPS